MFDRSVGGVRHHVSMTEYEGAGWSEADDVALAFEAIPATHRVTLSVVFLFGLTKPADVREVLEQLVTPESLPTWGDFTGSHDRDARDDRDSASRPRAARGGRPAPVKLRQGHLVVPGSCG